MTAFPLLEGKSRIGVVRPKGCLKTDIKASDTTIHNISIKKNRPSNGIFDRIFPRADRLADHSKLNHRLLLKSQRVRACKLSFFVNVRLVYALDKDTLGIFTVSQVHRVELYQP